MGCQYLGFHWESLIDTCFVLGSAPCQPCDRCKAARYDAKFIVQLTRCSRTYFIPEAIDEETFKVMWELSAPGGDAEGCFLRIKETEYFFDGRATRLSWMPDVRLFRIYKQNYRISNVIAHSTSFFPRTRSSQVRRQVSLSQRSRSTLPPTSTTSSRAFSLEAGQSSAAQSSTLVRSSKAVHMFLLADARHLRLSML